MNILITGALGFIGSHVAQRYLQQKHHVIGLDNRSGLYPSPVYSNTLSRLQKYPLFAFHPLDIRVRSDLSSLIHTAQPDVIIHTAAITGIRDSAKIPYECMETNVLGTQNVLDSCKNDAHVRIVLLSSSSVYGDQPTGPINENVPLKPKSIYAISKMAMESIARYYAQQFALSVLVVRPFSVYGPGGRMNMLPHLLLRSALTQAPFHQFGTNEQNQRDWTYIDDFVYALDRLISVQKNGFEIYNIGSDHPVGVADFIKVFQKHLPIVTSAPLRVTCKPKPSYEMDSTHADISALIRRIGVFPKTSLDRGLKNVLMYYRANPNIYFPK